ncbi:MAG: response regulator transcription factor [Chloroflexota bacterium]
MKKPDDTSSEKIRVLIVDDHAMVRQGLRTFLELQDQSVLPIEVTGEAANGLEAVTLAKQTQPDIVLLDLVMPEMDGVTATPKIMEASPNSRVIILTSFGEEDKVLPAIRAGAQGYLLKDIPPAELVQAVREAYQGKVQLHPEVAKKLMALAVEKEKPAPSRATNAENGLTDREQEVLQLIADGMSNRDIATKLIISEKTVKTHVSNILAKLNLDDRTQAAIYALRRGTADKK